ncbi:MAG: hypothetical protein JKY22_05920 [Flavobacteriaceae bacterium]|nr:hypothetical protein [Flavobacteriaceae bacterium]
MTNEKDCKPEFRYLFSDESINVWKKESAKRLEDEHKGKLFKKFINWKRRKNEIMLFTLYAYADLKIPKRFDCAFNLENPSEHTISPFSLTQSLYEVFFPTDSIGVGHKHTCIFEFENEIPELIKKYILQKGKILIIQKTV